jgi:membrane dipeptidase
VAGIDHVGLGSDFDGMRSGPVGLEDVSGYPGLLEELMRRGYSREDVAKIAGLNVLRVMEEAEAVAVSLRATEPPRDVLVDELDGDGHEEDAH